MQDYLVLRNAKYLDADKREFVEGDIAIKDGKIVGINGNFSGKEEKDLTGKYKLHLHIQVNYQQWIVIKFGLVLLI